MSSAKETEQRGVMSLMQRTTIIALFIAALLSVSGAFGQQNLDVETLAEKFFCTCGCSMLLSVCETQMSCTVAKQMKAQLKTAIEDGLSEGEIVNRMKRTYGSQVSAIAPKEGFTLTLWIYPVVGIALGSAAIYAISRRKRGVKWHVDPDDIPAIDEEKFAALAELDLEKRVKTRETLSKYDRMLKDMYEESEREKRDQAHFASEGLLKDLLKSIDRKMARIQKWLKRKR